MPHGGRRPGAGAPKGNMNGFRHGRRTPRLQLLAEALSQVPEVRDAFNAYTRGQRRRQQEARRTAAAILALIFDGVPPDARSLDRIAKDEKLFIVVFTRLLEEAARRRAQSSGDSPFEPIS